MIRNAVHDNGSLVERFMEHIGQVATAHGAERSRVDVWQDDSRQAAKPDNLCRNNIVVCLCLCKLFHLVDSILSPSSNERLQNAEGALYFWPSSPVSKDGPDNSKRDKGGPECKTDPAGCSNRVIRRRQECKEKDQRLNE